MEFKGQRKVIMEHLARQSGWKEDKEIVKDIALTQPTPIPLKSFRTVAGALKKEGLLTQEADRPFWVISEAGMKALQEVGHIPPLEKPLFEEPNPTEAVIEPPEPEQVEEPAPPTAPAQETATTLAQETKAAFERAEATAAQVEEAVVGVREAVAIAEQAAAVADEAKTIAASYIPAEPGPVAATRVAEPIVDMGPSRANVYSREALGLNEFQIFQKQGRDIGGMTIEKVKAIADVVYGDDPYNIDRVWANLGGMNVPIDIKKQWCLLWKTYLQKDTKQMEISPGLQSTLNPSLEQQAGVAAKPGDEKREWDIVTSPDGIFSVEKIGPGARFTREEAQYQLNSSIRQMQVAASQAGPQTQPEPISKLIEVLGPLLKSEGGGKDQEAEHTILKWLIDTKLGEVEKAVTGSQGKNEGLNFKDFMANLPSYAETLKTIAPIIKGALGIQDPPPAGAQQQPTAISLKDGNGNPVQMNLADLLTLKTFEAEQKRDDNAAEGREKTASSIRSFMDSISKAAMRAAGGTQQ